MKEEINIAANFITEQVKRGTKGTLKEEHVLSFSEKLSGLLSERFQDHWYQDKPQKGQAYRCIRTNKNSQTDPTIQKAAESVGLTYHDLNLPVEFTMWVDPKEVSYRLGENNVSWCMLFKDGKKVERMEGTMSSQIRSFNKQSAVTGTSPQGWQRNQINVNSQPQTRISPPLNMLKKKVRPFPAMKYHQFQQRISNTKNDRYHWVRGADLVKA